MRRDRLVSLLLEGTVGVVEAGAGYGKSALAAECRAVAGVASAVVGLGAPDDDPAVLVSSLKRGLRAGGLSDLAGALAGADPDGGADVLLEGLSGTAEPVLLVLDDVHHVRGPDTSELVLRLARDLPAPHRLLLLGRRLAPRLEPARRLSGAAFLDTAALALTAAEVTQLWQQRLGCPAADHDVRYLLEVTGGWATAVVLAVPVLGAPASGGPIPAGRGGAGAALPAGPDVITALTGAMLEALTPAERAVVAQLAHLPRLSPELVDDIAGAAGTFDRLVAVGIPLVRAQTGWWELPSPVGARLAARAAPSPAAAAMAARAYARGADILGAARVLLAAGSPEVAAGVLAGVSPEAAEDIGWAQLRDLVEALPEAAVAEHPRVLVHLARTAETAHRLDSRRSALERARAITVASAGREQDGLVRELDAERARYLMWDDRTRAEAAKLARAVLEQAGDGEIIARIRALDVLGRLGCALFSAEGTTTEAERFLAEAARLARRIGQRTWAAQALVPLATAIYHERCQFGRALATLDQALAVLPARGQYRALVLSFHCDVLAAIGRYREAAADLAEARAIGRAAGEEWALALASWGETLLASFTGDRDRTVRAVLDTEAHRDAWFDQSEGVEWLANAADALDRVGEHEMARERLTAARQRMAGYERPVILFEAAVLGRSGDPGRAEAAIAACLARSDLTPLDRWPLLLLRAYAALRRGDDTAGALAALAFDTCYGLGHPEGPLLRERAVARALLPIAAAAGSRAAADLLDGAGRLSVSLLGGFEARRGGALVDLPAGRPAVAMRVVCAAGGRIPAEALMEVLWPGTGLEAGRNRLRNLLSRLRATAGRVLVRDGPVISLEPSAEVDAV
ncbi:MAG: hypothetical protein ACRDPO_32030, partial [Streptosporangiaceae bacterium]